MDCEGTVVPLARTASKALTLLPTAGMVSLSLKGGFNRRT